MNQRLTEIMKPIKKQLKIPGDKSISHRALILAAIANGVTEIRNISKSRDVLSTITCLKNLGIFIKIKKSTAFVFGNGLHGLRKSNRYLDCENSGTTMRLLMGLLCSQSFTSILVGDESLSKRPMWRAAEPLVKMGARISLHKNNFAPIVINPTKLHAINFSLKIASAQIKSAIILSGLFCSEITTLSGLIETRDHTERLLKLFNSNIRIVKNSTILIKGNQKLNSCVINIPGDPSSAAFFIIAACLVPNAKIKLNKILLNQTRIGFINILKRMGANINIETKSIENCEPFGTVTVSYSILHAIQIYDHEISNIIDEIPILSIAFTQAIGINTIKNAQELRTKECDRLNAISHNLKKMGVDIKVIHDGFKIKGPQKLSGTQIETFGDHRIAMAFKIAGLIAVSEIKIDNEKCIEISDRNFNKNFEIFKTNYIG